MFAPELAVVKYLHTYITILPAGLFWSVYDQTEKKQRYQKFAYGPYGPKMQNRPNAKHACTKTKPQRWGRRWSAPWAS